MKFRTVVFACALLIILHPSSLRSSNEPPAAGDRANGSHPITAAIVPLPAGTDAHEAVTTIGKLMPVEAGVELKTIPFLNAIIVRGTDEDIAEIRKLLALL